MRTFETATSPLWRDVNPFNFLEGVEQIAVYGRWQRGPTSPARGVQ
jgi:hypothetical protein